MRKFGYNFIYLTILTILIFGIFFYLPTKAQEMPEDARSITISPLTYELSANPGEQIANKIKICKIQKQILKVNKNRKKLWEIFPGVLIISLKLLFIRFNS